jgi:glycine/D-amino acid oxidase-like deaminating enzyme
VPGLAGVGLEAARVGWRPMPGDGLSAVGPVPDLPGYWLVFTHSGVTLGPLLGRLVATAITSAESDSLLAPFRPDRLIEVTVP